MHTNAIRLIGSTVAIFLSASFTNAAEPQPTSAAKDASARATIEGTVVYQADSKRRWRYARYYVKDRKTGYLAEAVVALRGSKLRKWVSPARPTTAVIDQRDFRFIPETVTIRTGDRVKFANSDPQLHNINTSDGARPFNINLHKGDEQFLTFEKASGTRRPIRLGCVFHSAMRAWIFVFDHPFFQMTSENGRFRFNGVPPGEYRLEMVHPAGELKWSKQIKIEQGEHLKLDIRVSPDDKAP